MDNLIFDILQNLSERDLTNKQLDAIIREHSAKTGRANRIAKKDLLPYFQLVKSKQDSKPYSDIWERWNISCALEEKLIKTLQMKPRRSASGVATITVITKPWPCSGNCVFCPSDIRMPKSYLSNEPACQRAERNFFDPYLQVASRLQALTAMGHATDKIELIILGGTFTDYSKEYALWFVEQLFSCLNDSDETRIETAKKRIRFYECCGLTANGEEIADKTHVVQDQIDKGALTYNEALATFNQALSSEEIRNFQQSDFPKLKSEHIRNEDTLHKVVGLVVETRPDTLSISTLSFLRSLGCTKIQMGIQSLDEAVLSQNGRRITNKQIEKSLGLCRLFGFKTHVHFMVNLIGATPETDKEDYKKLVCDKRFKPDEVKLYPCALVESSSLTNYYQKDLWRPYTEDELIEVLCEDMKITPRFTRVSRMIRDISSEDIIAGNKKTNLRQMVENKLAQDSAHIDEIRYRELGTRDLPEGDLTLRITTYPTTMTNEFFLEWVASDDSIIGFLRLSLPNSECIKNEPDLPIKQNEAMIREVHIYGFATKVGEEGSAAQHHGLGRKLIEKACEIARENAYTNINVISAIGTRNYYRSLGFQDKELYQQLDL